MKQYKVVGGNIVMRKGPANSEQVLKIVQNGETVNDAGDEQNGWVRVEHEGVEGYCPLKFLFAMEQQTYDDDSISAAIQTAFANVQSAFDELKALIASVL